MEEKKLFIKEVIPGIFLMDEAHEATGYLVVGKERADIILHGHARDTDDISLLRCMREGVKEICMGMTEQGGSAAALVFPGKGRLKTGVG